MLKIKNTNENGSEYTLENGIQLFLTDWNGECYLTGATDIIAGYKDNNRRYIPIYENVHGEIEIIGFEEV